jgi:hypothetical protein
MHNNSLHIICGLLVLALTLSCPAQADVMCGTGTTLEPPAYWTCSSPATVVAITQLARELPADMPEDFAARHYSVTLQVSKSSLVSGHGTCPAPNETIAVHYYLPPADMPPFRKTLAFAVGDTIEARYIGSNCHASWVAE